MEQGDILGHEFMGEVVEVGRGVNATSCRSATAWSCRSRSPAGVCGVPGRAVLVLRELQPERLDGREAVGPLARRHLRLLAHDRRLRRRPGRVRARAVRRRRPDQDRPICADEQVLFLSDILPTGYMGAEMCDITARRRRRRLGRGPVGQFAMASARLLGAEQVIAIDRCRTGSAWPAKAGDPRSTTRRIDVRSTLLELTGGRGPDACIDAVGMEAHQAHADHAPTTGSSRRPGWRPTARTRCARRS